MSRSSFVDFRAVKVAVSMEQVLEHYRLLDGFKRGTDSLSGPCPIHKGKNPTQFRVSPSKNCWNCFSECKCGGNVLDFVAKMENIEVHAAALKMAEWCDLDVLGSPEDEKPKPAPDRNPGRNGSSNGAKSNVPAKATRAEQPAEPKGDLFAKADEIGCNKPLGFALKDLDVSHPYLTERGLTPETIAEFGLGFCTKGSMSGRIVIPIHNSEGKLLAYGGRFPGEPPEGQPKYRLPAGFKKSAELFNLHRAIKAPGGQPLIIVFGFFDVAKLWQHGARKVVALMGSFLSPAQEELITRHAHSVLLMFDEDTAGKLCREQVMLRLCTRLFVKVWPFAKEGDQPENLSFEDVQKVLANERER